MARPGERGHDKKPHDNRDDRREKTLACHDEVYMRKVERGEETACIYVQVKR